MFKKLLAGFLALTCTLSIGVTTFAATDLTGKLVDGDGLPAMDSSQTVRPGNDYYYIIGKSSLGYDILTNKNYVSFSMKKRDGSKYISGTDIVEKRFDGDRYVCIKLSVKDNFTADEYKVVMDATFKAKKDLSIKNLTGIVTNGEFPLLVPYSDGVIPYAATPSSDAAKAALTAAQTAYDNAVKAYNDNEAVITNGAKLEAALNDAKTKEAAAQKAYDDAVAAENKTAAIAAKQAEVKAAQDAYNTAKQKFDAAETLRGQLADLTAVRDSAERAQVTINGTLTTREAARVQIVTELAKVVATALDATTHAALIQKIGAYKTSYDNALDATQKDKATLNTYFVNQATVIANEKKAADDAVTAAKKAENDALAVVNAGGTQANLNALKNIWDAKVAELAALQGIAPASALTDQLLAALNAAKAVTVSAQTAFSKVESAYRGAVANKPTLTSNQTTATTNLADAKATYIAAMQAEGKNVLKAGESITNTFTMWIQNENRTDDDATFVVGEKGVVIRPVKNEWNTVTWENSNRTVAQMVFMADSEADFYCPRLSTKWSSRNDFSKEFKNQDVYVFDFVDNPSIPATSRADLSLYNPFVDNDDEWYVSNDDLYIYQAVDGELINVTSRFTAEINDDGDEVLTVKTRTLGTYFITDERVKLDNSSSGGSSGSNRPSQIIDLDNNQKPVPNTGR